jgi:protein involved in polysaccharide export with SLBB domain
MRVADLIPSRDVLLTREYWNRQNYMGKNPEEDAGSPYETRAQGQNQALNSEEDQLRVPAPRLYPRNNSPSDPRQSQSQFRNAGSYLTTEEPSTLNRREHWDKPNLASELSHADVMSDIDRASADINWDYAAIERRDDHDLSTRIVAFNLGNAIDHPASTDNQVLRSGDIITVFSRKDVPLPREKHATFVRVGGEVNAPGVYRVNPGDTLRDVVLRAGGLTSNSYLYASQLTRLSTRQAQEEQLRLSTAQMQKDLAARYAAAPTLNSSSLTEQQAQFTTQQALVAQLSVIHPTGRVVLDMKPGARTVADIPEFPLEDGDSFYIPARLGTIQVAGAVYNENAFRYQEKKRLLAYLKDAGGPTRQADVKRAFLIRADGTVVSKQGHTGPWRDNFEKLSLLPGDAIVVPNKLKSPNNFMQQLPFLTQILSQTAMTGAVIGTSY